MPISTSTYCPCPTMAWWEHCCGYNSPQQYPYDAQIFDFGCKAMLLNFNNILLLQRRPRGLAHGQPLGTLHWEMFLLWRRGAGAEAGVSNRKYCSVAFGLKSSEHLVRTVHKLHHYFLTSLMSLASHFQSLQPVLVEKKILSSTLSNSRKCCSKISSPGQFLGFRGRARLIKAGFN